MRVGSKFCEGDYSFGSRFEHEVGTNPEELIGAAHAGCFNMALTLMLDQAGFNVEHSHTVAKVHVDEVGEGYKITSIELDTEGRVPGCDERTFREKAEQAKKNCLVSIALAGVEMKL